MGFLSFGSSWAPNSKAGLYGATVGAGLSMVDQESLAAPLSGGGVGYMALGALAGHSSSKYGIATGIYNYASGKSKKSLFDELKLTQEEFNKIRKQYGVPAGNP